MKQFFFLLFCAAFTAANAQTPAGAPAAGAAAAMRGPIRSPEVLADGKVTFRLRDPNARLVILDVEGIGRDTMKKDAQGVWAVTRSLDPDIYDYSFQVDGLQIPDPANSVTKPGYQAANQSLAHIPGPASLSWEVKDTPHGTVNRHYYKSTAVGDQRDFYVYLPPNYDPNRKEAYPVLYLLHGAGGNALSWVNNGAANVILDNLINEGKAKPMIMVNTLGYGGTDKFTESLLKEVIPQVEKMYRASKDRSQRAIAGLSMGGGQALSAGLNNLDYFSYVAGFSSAVGTFAAPRPTTAGAPATPAPTMASGFDTAYPNLDAKANSKLQLLWVACGTSDFLYNNNKEFKNWLGSKGVKYQNVETPGGHTFMVWRRNLTDFAPLLFQAKAK